MGMFTVTQEKGHPHLENEQPGHRWSSCLVWYELPAITRLMFTALKLNHDIENVLNCNRGSESVTHLQDAFHGWCQLRVPQKDFTLYV